MATKPRSTPRQFYSTKTYRSEESVGFLLGLCLNRIVDAIDEALAELGIGAQQFGILHALLKGTARNPSELARLRFQNSAAITYTLDVLEEKQLVQRKRNANDRRVVNLELTEAGKALTRACIPRVVDAQNAVLQNLSQSDYRTLHALLHRIADVDPSSDSERTSAA